MPRRAGVPAKETMKIIFPLISLLFLTTVYGSTLKRKASSHLKNKGARKLRKLTLDPKEEEEEDKYSEASLARHFIENVPGGTRRRNTRTSRAACLSFNEENAPSLLKEEEMDKVKSVAVAPVTDDSEEEDYKERLNYGHSGLMKTRKI